MVSSSQLPFDFAAQDLFSFDDFVVADGNAELVGLLHSEVPPKEQFYFIWGDEGVGKSHLLQAVCATRENAVYVPLKQYARYGPEILDGLESMDFVCLDDIELVLNKPEWEERLFAFFNLLREQGKYLLISGSSSPRALETGLADLGSRLTWGVSYQLHELDDGDKTKALKRRIDSRGVPLNTEVLDYILLRSPRSMKALFKVVDTLDHLSLAEQRRITIPFVKNIMGW